MFFQTVVQSMLRRSRRDRHASAADDEVYGQQKKNRLPLLIAFILVIGFLVALVMLFPLPHA